MILNDQKEYVENIKKSGKTTKTIQIWIYPLLQRGKVYDELERYI